MVERGGYRLGLSDIIISGPAIGRSQPESVRETAEWWSSLKQLNVWGQCLIATEWEIDGR